MTIVVSGGSGLPLAEGIGVVSAGLDIFASGSYMMDFVLSGDPVSITAARNSAIGAAWSAATANVGAVGVKASSYGAAYYWKSTGQYMNRARGLANVAVPDLFGIIWDQKNERK